MQTHCLNSLSKENKNNLIKTHEIILNQTNNSLIYIFENFGYGSICRQIINHINDKEFKYYIKSKPNAFSNTAFRSDIYNQDIKNIIITGISANGCVKETINNAPKQYVFHTSKDLLGIPKKFDAIETKILDWYKNNTVMYDSHQDLITKLNNKY